MAAVAECTQGFGHRLQPLTICEYDIDCDPVADLRGETERDTLSVPHADLGCPWLSLSLAGCEPPSRLAADRLCDEGYVGALVPSLVPGAIETDQNLVLWRWEADLPCRVTVHNPAGRLPADQSSWR